MGRKLQVAGAAGAMALLAVTGAHAAMGERADFDLGFSPADPGARADLNLHIVYKAAGDPDAKPSPVRKVVLVAPPGTRFDTGAVPACRATDDELKARGSGACPPESRIGAGALTAMTGFGPPVDPVASDLTLFNTGDSVLEVVTAPGTDRVLGTDRLRISGSTLTGAPPVTPGGPPDGETSVRQIDFTIARATGFVTTPGSCPADGRWVSTGTFGFKDGAGETLTSETPCSQPPSGGGGAVAKAATLLVSPRRVGVGRSTLFRLRIADQGARCSRGVRVRVGGRRVRTDARGRARVAVTVRRAGAHRATAKKRGCPTLVARFSAR